MKLCCTYSVFLLYKRKKLISCQISLDLSTNIIVTIYLTKFADGANNLRGKKLIVARFNNEQVLVIK